MTWTTAAPQSTMIHSPLSSPSVRGAGAPADFTASRTLAASDLVCRLLVPDATMTRSKSGDRCSVLKTWMFWALTSSRPSTMTRCSLRMSIQLLVKRCPMAPLFVRGPPRGRRRPWGGPAGVGPRTARSAIQAMALNIARDRRQNEIGNRLARRDPAPDLGRRDIHHRQLHDLVRHVGDLRVRRRHGVGTIGNRERHPRDELAPVAPGVQPRVLVLTEDQHPGAVGLGDGELAHGVERVADAATAQLGAIEDEARLGRDREPHHRLAVGGGSELPRFL